MGPIESLLQAKISQALSPGYMELTNESPMHGLARAAEKHFRLIVVSEKFVGQSRVERHRLVHSVVADELRDHVHALSVQAFTFEEWQARQGKAHASPECLGGGKKHRP